MRYEYNERERDHLYSSKLASRGPVPRCQTLRDGGSDLLHYELGLWQDGEAVEQPGRRGQQTWVFFFVVGGVLFLVGFRGA